MAQHQDKLEIQAPSRGKHAQQDMKKWYRGDLPLRGQAIFVPRQFGIWRHPLGRRGPGRKKCLDAGRRGWYAFHSAWTRRKASHKVRRTAFKGCVLNPVYSRQKAECPLPDDYAADDALMDNKLTTLDQADG